MSELDDWVDRLCAALAVDVKLDQALVLDLARDAAHAVARPAAPLTTFLVGLAAGQRGATSEAIEDAVATALRLAVEQA
jgi:hypothetical protein